MVAASTRKLSSLATLLSGICMCILSYHASADVYLNIMIDGRAQPFVTSQAGSIGVNPSNGQLEETLAGAFIELDAGLSNILLRNPLSGTYGLTLHGAFNDKTSISVSYYDDVSGKRDSLVAWVWFHGNKINTSFVIDSLLDPAIQLHAPVIAPCSYLHLFL